MKKVFLLSILLIICLIVCSGCSRKNMSDALEESANFYYGISEMSNRMLESSAQSEGWNFIMQNRSNIIKLEGLNPNYITTFSYYFENPNNNNITRVLYKTYIFDSNYFDWAPLIETVWEMDKANDSLKEISSYKVWQGEYDTPIFKK